MINKNKININVEKFKTQLFDEAEYAYADFDEYKRDILGVEDIDDLPNDDFRYGLERAWEIFIECLTIKE